MDNVLQVKLLSDNAKLPKRATDGSAGYDLYSAENIIIPAKSRKLVNLDISITVPVGTYGRIAPRSGMSVKGIDIGAGIIDIDYIGIVRCLLINQNNNDFQVNIGDRIAQLILEECRIANVIQVEELVVTTRGAGGFGSTGV